MEFADKRAFFVGGNAKMNEFQSAMGLCNLKYVDANIESRKNIFEQYIEQLSCIDGINLPSIPAEIQHNYLYFPVIFENYKYTRDEVFDKLKESDIIARKYFYALTPDYECYQTSASSNANLPIAKSITNNVITFPLYSDLTLEEIQHIGLLIN